MFWRPVKKEQIWILTYIYCCIFEANEIEKVLSITFYLEE